MKFNTVIKGLAALAVLTTFTACDDEEATYVAPVTATTRDTQEVRTYGSPVDPYAASSTTTRRTTTTSGYVAPSYLEPVESSTTVRRKTTTVY